MEVIRTRYLDILKSGKGKTDLVKVLTGMRRSGKSTVLKQHIRQLEGEGIDSSYIFSLNFDLIADDIDYKTLNEMLSETISRSGIHYIFLDEIQDVAEWERTVAMLVARGDCDVYITGSNSKMLSSEIATRLSGRYVEIDVLPFSFKEYVDLRQGDKESLFSDYLKYGSLPVIEPERGDELCFSQLDDMFNTVLVKDILSHMKTDDVTAIKKIAKFLYSNIGNVTNANIVSKSLGINIVTVEKYILEMVSAHLFYYAERYDIVGKKILRSKGKYYATDLGMRKAVVKGANPDISGLIEDVVYLELIRRGYVVRIGSYRDLEVDFAAFKDGRVDYYQVAPTMLSDETRERELSGLKGIKDNHPKFILTTDRLGLGSYDGIEVKNLVDWLLE